MSTTNRLQHWGKLTLIASFSIIFVSTISPFDFATPAGFSGQFMFNEFSFGSDVKDYWQNILLFIPLGISLAMVLNSKQISEGTILVIVCLLSIIISSTIETTQLFLPSRVSNLTDIIFNSLGGLLGGIIYCKWNNIAQLLMGIATKDAERLSFKSLLVAITGYCSVVTVLILTLVTNVNLSNWNDDFYLTVGNEATGNRPWNGYVRDLYISDRSLNQSEVAQALEQADDFFARSKNLVTSFELNNRQKHYQDRSQHIPRLSWQNLGRSYQERDRSTSQQRIDDPGAWVNSRQWLRTEQFATPLIRRLRDTGEFSIYLTVLSNNSQQFGPARIMALSKGIYAQNIVVGQQGENLSFRLRTPITGNNAAQPEFIIPRVFRNHEMCRILVTFANRKLHFYINNSATEYSFQFTPANSFLIYLPWEKKNWVVNLEQFKTKKYELLFFIVVVTPLSVLGASLFYYSMNERNS